MYDDTKHANLFDALITIKLTSTQNEKNVSVAITFFYQKENEWQIEH